MTEREGFLRAIAEDVYDDSPRLIFADWLEDHGEPERAEFIRVQCELEPIRDRFEIDRAVELHAREDELLGKRRKKWLGRMPKGWDDWRTGASVEFRRGSWTRSLCQCGHSSTWGRRSSRYIRRCAGWFCTA